MQRKNLGKAGMNSKAKGNRRERQARMILETAWKTRYKDLLLQAILSLGDFGLPPAHIAACLGVPLKIIKSALSRQLLPTRPKR